jgi:hypothetical protein
MIAGIVLIQQFLWIVNGVAGIFLLFWLASRKNHLAFPAFFFYIFVNLCLGASVYFIYRHWGFSSVTARRIAWAMVFVVVCARAMAVAEVCRRLLGRYRGIWALAWRIFLASAVLVLLYSAAAGRHRWELVLPSAQRGMELAIAAVIVLLLIFIRYYGVHADPADRSLAVGFCLYSCFNALNNTILERYLYSYAVVWNVLGMLVFLASLSLWAWALRAPQPAAADTAEALHTPEIYQSIMPQINVRLRALNEQLSHFWKAEATRN